MPTTSYTITTSVFPVGQSVTVYEGRFTTRPDGHRPVAWGQIAEDGSCEFKGLTQNVAHTAYALVGGSPTVYNFMPTVATVKGANGAVLVSPQHLDGMRALLADAWSAVRTMVLLGDSIPAGTGADDQPDLTDAPTQGPIYRTQGMAGILARRFAAIYGVCGDYYNYRHVDNTGATTSVAIGSGADVQNYGVMHGATRINAVGKTITHTIPAGNTDADTYIWAGSNDGSTPSNFATLTVDGGAATPIVLPNASDPNSTDWSVLVPISGLSTGSSHTAVITATAGFSGSLIVGGFMARRQAFGVPVVTFAHGGDTAANLYGADAFLGTAGATAQNRFRTSYGSICNPAGLIAMIGNNDYNKQLLPDPTLSQPGTIPGQFYRYMRQCCTDWLSKSPAGVLLVGTPDNSNAIDAPSPGTAGIHSQAAYRHMLARLALEMDNVAYLDLNQVWGGYTRANSRGLYNTGSVHPTRKGHADIADILFDVLTRPVAAV
jgi:lysophospholipase L1-like esterase